MDLNQFLLALKARRKAFYTVLAATVFTALAIALIVPKNYVAATTVLIDARDEQQLSAAERLSPRERTGYLQTQMDLLMSGRVAKRVVRDLKIAQMPGVREDYERDTGGNGTLEDWASAQLLKKLKVDATASNVLTVSFGSPDPKYSAAVANGFANAYLATALELRTEPTKEAAAWFEEQLKGLRANVSQTQAKLTAYQKEKGITPGEERGDIESTRLAELSSQMLRAREATYDATARYKNASEFLSNASVGASADQLPEVMANPAVMAIKGALVAAESRLEQSANDLGPNHPAYQRNVAEVEGLRGKLASEMKKVVSGLSNSAQQSRRREEELRNAYAAQTERMLSMRDARVEMAVLSRDVENAQRTYDAALQKWLTIKVDSRARMTNIAVLTPAIEPLEPKSPKVGLITALSIMVGALLAAGVVFLLETMDRRVRSRGDLESKLAVPSLGRLSKWQPSAGRLLPAPYLAGARAVRALPHPW
jgi:succinoglycan biosynthesis transport protein ExoP